MTAEEIKDFYRYNEDNDLTSIADHIVGPETFFHRSRMNQIRKMVETHGKRGGAFLDMGCGTALITRFLPEGSVGVDINPRHLEHAKHYAPHITFICADIENTGLDSASFDTIIATEVLEHLLGQQTALKEIKRLLKPGGVFIGSVPSNGVLWRLRFLSRNRGKEPYHRHFSKEDAREMLEQHFENITLFRDFFRMNWFFACHL